MNEPETLVMRTGPSLCSRCNCIYERVFLFVEPVFAFPGGDGQELRLSGLATMRIVPCCGHIEPTAIRPERVITVLEAMKDKPFPGAPGDTP
jgi:hypothetical protein